MKVGNDVAAGASNVDAAGWRRTCIAFACACLAFLSVELTVAGVVLHGVTFDPALGDAERARVAPVSLSQLLWFTRVLLSIAAASVGFLTFKRIRLAGQARSLCRCRTCGMRLENLRSPTCPNCLTPI